MGADDGWIDVGAAAELAGTALRRVAVENSELAISWRDGTFGAVANACNHAGGPLGDGHLDGDYIVCPWHHWKFHRATGTGCGGPSESLFAYAGTRSARRKASAKSWQRSA